ncbi:hypothetical protein [Mycolicibacterium sphagni]|uniref:Uncharacterized protein n=1 Tax=Mycolicibacterium sphagni TaxID=1786 RepID=A0A255E0Q8_9MYCO|nr:hypothetical protein [Mycolicibacterium sphagni]OYN82962.1 hypothetical protein CG716_01835 [Mycolicibacterium sphagni]
MITQNTDVAQHSTSWRDLIDQLTPNQIKILEGGEQRSTPPADLIEVARDFVKESAEQAKLDSRLSHIEIPPGATADKWSSIRADDGDAIRWLQWRTFDTAKARVSIVGIQDESASFTRWIRIQAQRGDIDDEELSPPDVRELVRALSSAADDLEALERNQPS